MRAIICFVCLLLTTSTYASEAVGYYSNGSLENSVPIDSYIGSHWRKLYRARKQNYGTHETMRAIAGLSDYMKSMFPSIEVTQVGDISAVKGRKIRRHASHQNGLDSDMVYYRVNEKPQDASYPEWAEDFVIKGKLTKNFHIHRNWVAMKYLVNNHDVGRIFVDGAIKRALCNHAKKIGEYEQETETLRRLRIENKVHMHHFHLRLKCPAGNTRCTPQFEPPAGSGC